MKTRLWLLLAGAAFVLLTSRDVEASGACTAARFHDWNDMGCNQNCASAGAPSNGGCPACDNGGIAALVGERAVYQPVYWPTRR